MKVKELIEELNKFNPDAKIIIDNLYDDLKLDLSWGFDKSADGDNCKKENCDHMSLYLFKHNDDNVNKEKDKNISKEYFKIKDPEFKELLNSSIYFIESTAFERMFIKEKISRQFGSENWNEDSKVYFRIVGLVSNNEHMPIGVALYFTKIFNSVICFYSPKCRFSDSKCIVNWIRDNYDGDAKFCTAVNWQLAIKQAIENQK